MAGPLEIGRPAMAAWLGVTAAIAGSGPHRFHGRRLAIPQLVFQLAQLGADEGASDTLRRHAAGLPAMDGALVHAEVASEGILWLPQCQAEP